MDEVCFCSVFFGLFVSILLAPPLFCILWHFPEIYQLTSDLLTGDSPLARTERDRELEGRLFDPQHRPPPGQPLVWRKPSRSGFPEFPLRHTFHFL